MEKLKGISLCERFRRLLRRIVCKTFGWALSESCVPGEPLSGSTLLQGHRQQLMVNPRRPLACLPPGLSQNRIPCTFLRFLLPPRLLSPRVWFSLVECFGGYLLNSSTIPKASAITIKIYSPRLLLLLDSGYLRQPPPGPRGRFFGSFFSLPSFPWHPSGIKWRGVIYVLMIFP